MPLLQLIPSPDSRLLYPRFVQHDASSKHPQEYSWTHFLHPSPFDHRSVLSLICPLASGTIHTL
uniref:Putative ovule protein n=1 Tax=Solanum chacoense TaxID=4108 RepID=A0A0V0GK88_SOLCH